MTATTGSSPLISGDDPVASARHTLVPDMRARMERLLPMCRSITGNGVRATLADVADAIPLDVHEVPTGTAALDWTVPREWNIRAAWIRDSAGRTIVDFAESNLHVVSYSVPVHSTMTRAELQEHLHSLPDRPRAIPYVTAYYSETWGFCLTHEQREALADDTYEVFIDSTLADGHLSYGELVVPGLTTDEILITTHVCHPSLANDNLTGIAMLTTLGQLLRSGPPRRHTYRLLFIPGTIGSLTWLAGHRDEVTRIRHGIVITGLGDAGRPTWKLTRNGTDSVDRAMRHVLTGHGPHRVMEYYPYGYDERQFTSPGFALSVGRFGRSVHGEYPEYHTSADDLEFINDDSMADSLLILGEVLDVLDDDGTYLNLAPFGEPQLGRRGLYRAIGGAVDRRSAEMAVLWVLNQSDGAHSLLDIAEMSGLGFRTVREAADQLLAAGLLEPAHA